jgi:GNAT superfamily N-acetyltransferase
MMQFDQDYEEAIRLRDGTRANLRPIRASDKRLLLEGFERLSPRSRYMRFLAPKQKLTDGELRYLTEVDGVDHFALVALTRHLLGQERGIGVGRFVRLTDEADTAEPAITVADDYQGKGLGTILLHRLSDAAWERGIRRFRCELLADNTRMQELLDEIGTEVHLDHVEGGALIVTFPLEAPAPDERRSLSDSVRRVFSYVARELVSFIPRATRHPEEVP